MSGLQEKEKVFCERSAHHHEVIERIKRFLDMTFGAGGHTRALLEKASDIMIYALDRDPTAYKIAQQLSESYPKNSWALFQKYKVDETSHIILVTESFHVAIPRPPSGTVFVLGIAVTRVRDLAFGLVELLEVCAGLLLKPVKVLLDGIPSLQHVDHSTQPGVIGKLAEGVLNLSCHLGIKPLTTTL
ncbi:methyltransferasehypothetical protein [Limosa lapponica baueri]|uniref:Uncharacterized protein n=1 Tax=Limosa lapponica baueri TaxID=1758121 RepID=A0A2I0U1Q4_LIMLA|nr:methyltransferasehypothetical protein [Limosa lapponica baueri]